MKPKNNETISFDLHTDLIPIVNMFQYEIANGVDITREELNQVMKDIGSKYIEQEIKKVFPEAIITFGEFHNPKYYQLFSNLNDTLDFTITLSKVDYEKKLYDTISFANFDEFLHNTYKSYDGFMSFMADNINDFDKQEDWKIFVSVLTYYLTPYEYQTEFTNEVQEYIWSNFLLEEDEENY